MAKKQNKLRFYSFSEPKHLNPAQNHQKVSNRLTKLVLADHMISMTNQSEIRISNGNYYTTVLSLL